MMQAIGLYSEAVAAQAAADTQTGLIAEAYADTASSVTSWFR